MASTTYDQLRGLILSATELRDLHPDWSEAMIEDYLNIFNNFITVTDLIDVEIDKLIEETPTLFSEGSIPFANAVTGLLEENNTDLVWDNVAEVLKPKNVIISTTTASLLLATNGSNAVVSVPDLTAWIAGTADEINVSASGGGVVIGIINPLIVGKGGSGAASFTDGGILLGSGTGAFTALAQATNGQLPVGSTGVDPVLATLTGTADKVTVANGAGTITLSIGDNFLPNGIAGTDLQPVNDDADGTVSFNDDNLEFYIQAAA